MPSSLTIWLCIILLCSAEAIHAEAPKAGRLELGVTYISQRSIKAGTSENFWMQGGSVELGADLWRGLGIAADVTGGHSSSVGASGLPLSLVTVTFGPRYRWHANRHLSLYGQGLVGEANAFRTLIPTQTGSQSDANSFAVQVGGGVDYRVSSRLAIRLIDAGWLRTQLPNSTNNLQNNLRLGAGVVLRFGKRK